MKFKLISTVASSLLLSTIVILSANAKENLQVYPSCQQYPTANEMTCKAGPYKFSDQNPEGYIILTFVYKGSTMEFSEDNNTLTLAKGTKTSVIQATPNQDKSINDPDIVVRKTMFNDGVIFYNYNGSPTQENGLVIKCAKSSTANFQLDQREGLVYQFSCQ